MTAKGKSAEISKCIDDWISKAPDDKRPRNLLPLQLPEFDEGLSKMLQAAGLPDPAEMVRQIDNIAASDSELHWRYTGSGYYSDVPGLVDLSKDLCEHPDEYLKTFVWNMLVEYFPEENYTYASTYFREEYPSRQILSAKAAVCYSVMRYVCGDDDEAERLLRTLSVSGPLRQCREVYRSRLEVFAYQKGQIERLMKDIKKWLRRRDIEPAPDWRDYLRKS